MKIALIGYGNMGREIESLVSEDKVHSIVSISYKTKKDKLNLKEIKKADVAIDFTSPDVVLENINKILPLGIKMVIGTTGWYEYINEVKKIVNKYKAGLLYGQNFSIGGNIFFQITDFASKLFSQFNSYDVAGLEMHHTGKKDSPSGTAKKLATIIMNNFPNKKALQTQKLDRQINKDELHFASLRVGSNFGHHEIIFDSIADEIKLSHTAHSRRGFAEGAILASAFIKNKKGFYSFDDLFSFKKRKGVKK